MLPYEVCISMSVLLFVVRYVDLNTIWMHSFYKNIKYLIGILFGWADGFLIGFIWNKIQKKEAPDSIKMNVGSYLLCFGEIRVYRAYMKEIVTSVDHVWGDIGKKYFSWMLSEKKLAMVFEFEVDFVYN